MQHDVQLVKLFRALRCPGSRTRVKGMNWPEHSTHSSMYCMCQLTFPVCRCLEEPWKQGIHASCRLAAGCRAVRAHCLTAGESCACCCRQCCCGRGVVVHALAVWDIHLQVTTFNTTTSFADAVESFCRRFMLAGWRIVLWRGP
jgi:hypothetical protein